jgi:hypothetical protein
MFVPFSSDQRSLVECALWKIHLALVIGGYTINACQQPIQYPVARKELQFTIAAKSKAALAIPLWCKRGVKFQETLNFFAHSTHVLRQSPTPCPDSAVAIDLKNLRTRRNEG